LTSSLTVFLRTGTAFFFAVVLRLPAIVDLFLEFVALIHDAAAEKHTSFSLLIALRHYLTQLSFDFVYPATVIIVLRLLAVHCFACCYTCHDKIFTRPNMRLLRMCRMTILPPSG